MAKGYTLLRYSMQFILRVYFKRVFIRGLADLDLKKPTILASNHPNSFLDALVLGTIQDKPFYSLARSDVFNTPFKRKLLGSINLVPIYRLQEGVENMHKNEETFASCNALLREKKSVLIFAEGLSIVEKRLRKLKKGTARIAFGAIEQGVEDLQIVPTVLNYTYPTDMRSEVIIHFDRAISPAQYLEAYPESRARAITQMNGAIEEGLKRGIISIDLEATEAAAETVLEMVRNESSERDSRWKVKGEERLELEKNWCESINVFQRDQPDQYAQWEAKLKAYTSALAAARITDYTIGSSLLPLKLGQSVGLLLGWPFAIVGSLFTIWPSWLAKRVAEKKVRLKEFYMSIHVAIWYLSYFLQYAAATLVAGIIGGWEWTLALLPLPLYSIWSYRWGENGRTLSKNISTKVWRRRNKDLYQQLLKQRQILLTTLVGNKGAENP